jgi:probable HAF family extracellular repeat protein
MNELKTGRSFASVAAGIMPAAIEERFRQFVAGFPRGVFVVPTKCRPIILVAVAWLAASSPVPGADVQYQVTDLGLLPGYDSAIGLAINAAGQVTGQDTDTTAFDSHAAFLYSSGGLTGLGSLPGFTNSSGTAINNRGQIVGNAFNSGDTGHAFLYSGGTMTDLGNLPGYSVAVFASGINDRAQITGEVRGPGGVEQAFLYSGGVMTGLGILPGYQLSRAFGINNSGQIVGYNYNGIAHAFIYSKGTMTDLGTLPGGETTYGYAINDYGEVTGGAISTNGVGHAFLYSAGTMFDLGALQDYPGAEGNSINGNGDVAGTAFGTNSAQHAFLYHGGLMYDLNSLINPSSGWVLDDAEGINDQGQITGGGEIDGAFHAFLLTPIPEPSAIGLAAAVLAGFVSYRSRKRTSVS